MTPLERPEHVDLVVASTFSLLRGASMPEELVHRAAALGAPAIAITDHHSVAGVVRAREAAKQVGIRLVPGTRVSLWRDPTSAIEGEDADQAKAMIVPSTRLDVVLHATSPRGWASICRLLSLGKRRAPKGRCRLVVHDLLEHHDDVLATVLMEGPPFDGFRLESIEGLVELTDLARNGSMSLGIHRLDGPEDERRIESAIALGRRLGIPLVAHNDVHLHEASRRPVQDVLACIRHGCTIEEAGDRLHPNDERRLRTTPEMRDRFADLPEAVDRSAEIAHRAMGWSLDDLRYRYPSEVVPTGETAMSQLRRLVATGARERFGPTVPKEVASRLEHEFRLIEELDYPRYFLTVHDIVRFARERGILCQGRGAAANSAVCYCLGVTAVDPTRIDMLFERFVSRERDEPPDIDIDFEHERREEVLQYVYGKYGRDRAALVAEVICFRGRSAIRDVGTALGLSRDLVQRLAADIEWWNDGIVDRDRIRGLGIDPEAPAVRRLVDIARTIIGFPRHLSQHVGGFVIADRPLWEIVPIENAAMPDRTVIEWDKDDVDAMGMLKVDCLGLGMLSCIRKTIDLVNRDRSGRPADRVEARTGPRRLELHTIPAEDPAVYDMVSAADTVGVFQIESRAQMSMLPRLRPRCWYDLVIEVAIVRPGPIQGQMVHPYLRRRNGEDPVEYPDDAVRRVLEKTLGVPLFQEQAMSLAVTAAGFTPGEADALRRAIAAWKRHGNAIAAFGERLEEGMIARGYDRTFARQVFTQIQGFSGYGFPESHAASFALLVYASSWLKCREPAAFAAALVNSQPMGFYAPAQIVRDARDHGVEIRRIDALASEWDCTLERTPAAPWDPWIEPSRPDRVPSRSDGTVRPRRRPRVATDQPAIRLGLRLVRGLAELDAHRIVEAVRMDPPPRTLAELHHRSGVSTSVLRRLARADAFRSLGIDRQRAIWELQRLKDDALPLFDDLSDPTGQPPRRSGIAPDRASGIEEPEATLPSVSRLRSIVDDYQSMGLSLDRHPIGCIRNDLDRRGAWPAARLDDPTETPDGIRLAVAGVVLVRQRPSTAGGIVFMTVEDETGIANLVLKPRIYRRHRAIARHAAALVAFGRVERRGEVVHVVVNRIESLQAAVTTSESVPIAPATSKPDESGNPASLPSEAPGPEHWKVTTRAFR